MLSKEYLNLKERHNNMPNIPQQTSKQKKKTRQMCRTLVKTQTHF